MLDIDKKDDSNGCGALHHAILSNDPKMVELLLKDYHANPNVVSNQNATTLMRWATVKDRNLSILELLVKYGFDFVKLVNEHENKSGFTVFHFLCSEGNSDHNIACLKRLFSICEKISNCSINILATVHVGMSGLHLAIFFKDVNMIKYLLENVYFPNNDKSNKDGIAAINMRLMGNMSLPIFLLKQVERKHDRDVKRDLEMFKLFASYVMEFKFEDLRHFLEDFVSQQYVEVVEFILNNVLSLHNIGQIVLSMYARNGRRYGSINTAIMKAFYNHGLEHGVICNKLHHSQIIREAAKYELSTFKTTLSMILEKHGNNDLKQYKQCDIIDETTLKTIAHSPDTKPNVKSFIEALMCDETKLLKLDDAIARSNEVVLTCINNHELDNSNDNKILNCKEKCSVCGDSGDGSQSLCGFKCDECKSFICDDCIIVQKISKKINANGNNKSVLHAVGNEILEYKNNKKLLNKVEFQKFVLI